MKNVFDNYEAARPYIKRFIFDPDLRPEFLKNRLAISRHGKLCAIYIIYIPHPEDDTTSLQCISERMLKRWDISLDTLIKDVCDSELEQVHIFNGISFGENLYYSSKKFDDWDILCLTNTDKQFGASLILNKAIRQGIGEIVGGHFIVLPSSVHEVMIVRDANEDLDYFYDMLAEFNANPMIVKPKDVLCNTPFWCSKDGEMMMDLKLAKEDIEED